MNVLLLLSTMQRGGMIALLLNIFRSRYLGQVAAFAICIPGNGDVTTFETHPPYCFCIALVDCDGVCIALVDCYGVCDPL